MNNLRNAAGCHTSILALSACKIDVAPIRRRVEDFPDRQRIELRASTEAAILCRDCGGATVSLALGGDLRGAKSYVVSAWDGEKHRNVSPRDILGMSQLLRSCAEECGPSLFHRRICLGGWLDSDSEGSYFQAEIGILFPRTRRGLRVARRCGRAWHQKCLHDLYTGRNIPTHGDGIPRGADLSAADKRALLAARLQDTYRALNHLRRSN